MASNEPDELMSLSTIRILTGLVKSPGRPPSSSQVSSCCASVTCTGGICALRGLAESPCFRDSSERRLQLVVTVSCILHAYRTEHANGRRNGESVRWDTDPALCFVARYTRDSQSVRPVSLDELVASQSRFRN